MPAPSFPGFSAAAIEFLVELTENNDRAWFKSHQQRYEAEVRGPALAFIRALAPRLTKLSRNFVASDRKVGGSMMRPQRDTRFGGDKTPYKTNVGIHFRHNVGKDVHAPGFYFHFDPAEVFIGAGMWRPDPPALAAVRARLLDKPKQFGKVLEQSDFRRWYELSGESLKRPPAGVAADHPLIEHLKRKDHIALARLTHAQLCSPKLLDLVETRLVAAKPYVKFLCDALEVPF
jgi:uncharacterized protein (TIGR02453 family)